MKKTSKIFSVVLALVLVFAMAIPAFAADDGTITITNAVDGADYEIYKMLNFVPSNDDGDKGIYTIVTGWEDFFAAEPATNYFTVTTNADQTTVALKKGVTAVDQTLAKAAIAYAEENTIAATATETADSETVEFTGLALGYYAIDTSLGTLCALTNTNSNFTATEKNTEPTIDKFVQEDADDSWGKVNDADIDQVVNYKSTVTVGLGATNYVMHDTMEAGLTFNPDSVVVKLADGTVVDAANYTVVYPATDGHTFDVTFDDAFIAGIAQGETFTVYYSATLNENAKIVTDGNDNTVYLSYGEDSTWESKEDKTTTYTWEIDVFKKNAEGNGLAGAKFQLLDATKTTVIGLTKVDDDTYKVDADGTAEIVTVDGGKFEIIGLDEGTYYLEETEAPAGYNKLANPIEVVVSSVHKDDELTATYEFKTYDEEKQEYVTVNEVEVLNLTGGLLPETGGIGTTIFYVAGIVLVLGAAVLLITKKRMSCEA